MDFNLGQFDTFEPGGGTDLIDRGFILLDSSGRFPRFAKDVIRVGEWIHPTTGQKLDFTAERLAALVLATNRWLAIGNKVWFPAGDRAHNSDSMKNLGFWTGFTFDGENVVGIVEVRDQDAIDKKKIGTTITDVSIGVSGKQLASTGERFEEVILHVAATPQPVINGQGNFIHLAREAAAMKPKTLAEILQANLSEQDQARINKKIAEHKSGGGEGGVGAALAVALSAVLLQGDEPIPAPAPMPTPLPEPAPAVPPLASLMQMLGLPADADEASAIDALRAQFAVSAPAPAAASATPAAPAVPIGPALSLSAAQERIKVLEKREAESRMEQAKAEVDAVDQARVDAGQEPLGQDKRTIALTMFANGQKTEARAFLDLARTAGAAPTKPVEASIFGSVPISQVRDEAEEKKHRDLHAETLTGLGYELTRDASGVITKMVPPHLAHAAGNGN